MLSANTRARYGTLLERRNCDCLTRISRITRTRTDGITGEHLGLDNLSFDRNDLGRLLASRGRSPRKTEIVQAETPAVDATGASPRNPRNLRLAVAVSSFHEASTSIRRATRRRQGFLPLDPGATLTVIDAELLAALGSPMSPVALAVLVIVVLPRTRTVTVTVATSFA